jgi:DHA1 family bicyclomycin/chloramphenicol resistance-like MFS transporter
MTLVLGGLAAFGPFSIDTIFPRFPADGCGSGRGQAAAADHQRYLLASAAMSLVHGPAHPMPSVTKRVLVGGLLVYMLASAGCALSHDLTMLLSFRALQGMSAGAGLIVRLAMIRTCSTGRKRRS